MPGGDGPDARVETLYRRMFHILYAYALRGMSDPSLAEEAVQDTFRVACEREDKLFASDNPEGWLMNVLKNVIRSTRRERARLAETVLEVLDENGGAADVELDLDTLYGDLSASEDFRLLKRIALDRCTILEAAEELGIPLETCKKRVQRARKRLQKRLREDAVP